MQRHKVNALFGLFFNFGKQLVRMHGGYFAAAVQKLLSYCVERHCAQRKGACCQHLYPDAVQISCDGKIHGCVGPGFLSNLQLLQLQLLIAAKRGCSYVGIDLDRGRLAHKNRMHVAVTYVAKQNYSAFVQA